MPKWNGSWDDENEDDIQPFEKIPRHNKAKESELDVEKIRRMKKLTRPKRIERPDKE